MIKLTIKITLATILFFAISCKKETTSLTSSDSASDVMNAVTGKYPSVLIGTQKWMSTNLSVTRYRNGDKIPQVRNKADWAALTTGAWCWNNNDSANGAVYGKLYNWYAVNDPRGLAPTGWHIPSALEWDTLSTYLGSNAGGKLKSTGTVEAGTGLWYNPNAGATNETGFTGLPGGSRHTKGGFEVPGYNGVFWTSTESSTDAAMFRDLYYGFDYIYGNGNVVRKRNGYSVRCIKD